MNLLLKISTIIFLFFSFDVTAQNAIDYYNSAKTALERGDVEIGLRHLNSCQNILGGSNAKIESLRFQGYYQKGNYLEAAKSFKIYNEFLSTEMKNSNAYKELKSLHEEVWKQLNAEKKAEEEKLKNEINRELAQLKDEKSNYESAKKNKIEKAIENNAKEIAKVALETKDSTLMSFYKKNFSVLGKTNKTLEIELDKKENPIKYKRLDEIARITADIYSNYQYGNSSYRNYNYYYKADSMLNYLFNNYRKSEFEESNLTKLKSLQVEVIQRYNWNKVYYEKRNKIKEYDEYVIRVENMQGNFFDTDGIGRGIAGGGLAGVGMGGLFYLIDGSDALSKTFLVIGGVGVAVGGIIMLSEYISYQSYLKRMRKAKAKLERMKADIGPVLEKRNEKLNGLPLISI
jgi:hypothetical protein